MTLADPSGTPEWLTQLLATPEPAEGLTSAPRDVPLEYHRGIWRSSALLSAEQEQTAEAFGFKWAKRDTFDGDEMVERTRRWLIERYGEAASASWWAEYGDQPLLVDAGCGASLSALALFGDRLRSVRYLGIDVSTAVDVARERCGEEGVDAGFLQADLGKLPIEPGSVDVVFSEGVLHHTDSTEAALRSVVKLLRPGGRLLFYVYRRKSPIREFVDDHVRAELQASSPDEAWDALRPLTRLGIALGELDVEVEVPERVDLLEIPAGRYDLQRFFYWYIAKAYFDPDLTFEEMNHINYDWYAPCNAHRHTVEEVKGWLDDLDMTVEHRDVQEAGITIVARLGDSP